MGLIKDSRIDSMQPVSQLKKSDPTSGISSERLSRAIHRALVFLQNAQLPSGGFKTFLVPAPATRMPAQRDSSPFPAALMAHCLSFSPHAESAAIREGLLSFLKREMDPNGVWRYFASDHPWHRACPNDLDDSATAYSVLQAAGIPLPSNRSLILSNRDPRGLFYTWLIPRRALFLNPRSFLFALKESIRIPIFKKFFTVNESKAGDIDAVVNANVLYMLGKCEETQPVLCFLREVILNNLERTSDKWHLSPFNHYYFLSKSAWAEIEPFSDIKDLIIQRILAASAASGIIGEHALDTALALCTLFNFRSASACIPAAAVEALLAAQQDSGAWPSLPLYYGGPTKACSFESEELTTAFCLEALVRCSLLQ